MKADFHIHSSFSADSQAPMTQMIERGISLGLETMCFTEHMDFGMQYEDLLFEVDTPSYFQELERCQSHYRSQIEILFGIELGLEPHQADRLRAYVKEWPFDFIIGSSHLVNGTDPYDAAYFQNRTEREGYRDYFLTMPDNLQAFADIDVYGHLDYVVRYGPDKNKYYSYEQYRDVIDAALTAIIEHGVGLEVNTGGCKYGLGHPHPHPDILKRYRDMGGEIITVGSDAHAPEHLAYEFTMIGDLLRECGFKYHTVFRKRKPEFIKI